MIFGESDFESQTAANGCKGAESRSVFKNKFAFKKIRYCSCLELK